MADTCFACGRKLRGGYRWARVAEEQTVVYVGSDCYRHIAAAGSAGWLPPRGAARLHVLTADETDAFIARGGETA